MRMLASVSLFCASLGLWRVRQKLGECYEIGAAVVQVGVIFWFLIPGLSTALTPEQWHQQAVLVRIDNSDALYAFLAVSLFHFGFTLAYLAPAVPGLVALQLRVFGVESMDDTQRAVRVLFIAALASLAFYVVAAGGVSSAFSFISGSRTVLKPWDSQGNYGTQLSPFHVLFSSILVAVSVYTTHLALSARMPRFRTFAVSAIAVLCVLTVAVESGTRSMLLLCLGPPVILFSRAHLGRGVHLRAAVLVGGFVVMAIVAANLQRTYRTIGDVEQVVDLTVRDNDLLVETAFAVAVRQLGEELTYDSAFINILTGPFPRYLWKVPLKNRCNFSPV